MTSSGYSRQPGRVQAPSGTADDSAPWPQLRAELLPDVATRAVLAVAAGPAGTDKAAAEQALLDQAMTHYPHAFTMDRIVILDRNYPGAKRIAKLMKRTHVLIRLKSDIPLTRVSGFFPDGSYLAEISGDGVTVTVRVIEYDVEVEGQDVPETFCLITDLHDWQAHPAAEFAALYKWRWDGSETGLRENKSCITGSGPGTGPMLRSGTPDLVYQELAALITATELVRGLARDAAAAAAPARKGRRAGQPVHPREISFTAARRARPVRRLHRQPPGGHDRRRLPGRHRRRQPVPDYHRQEPAPGPQNQVTARLPPSAPQPGDPHRDGRDHRLRRSRRLNRRQPGHEPPPSRYPQSARGTGCHPGTTARPLAYPQTSITHRNQNRQSGQRRALPETP